MFTGNNVFWKKMRSGAGFNKHHLRHFHRVLQGNKIEQSRTQHNVSEKKVEYHGQKKKNVRE